MTPTLRTDVDSARFYELLRATKRQTIGRFFLDRNLPQEEAFQTVAEDLMKLYEKPDLVRLELMTQDRMEGVAIVDESKWDSEIFDLKYGKMKLISFHPSTTHSDRSYLLENLTKKLVDHGFKLVVARAPMDVALTINAMERAGAVLTDVLITFQRKTDNLSQPKKISGVRVEKAAVDDEEEIVAIGRKVFKIDHFHADSRLPSKKADELYAKWTKSCLHGLADVVLVAKKGDSILGFITCKSEHLTPSHRYGFIDLVGVTADSKGKGIGAMLLDEALKWFSKTVPSVYVGTQAANTIALRLYEKSLFKIVYAEATMHLWLP